MRPSFAGDAAFGGSDCEKPQSGLRPCAVFLRHVLRLLELRSNSSNRKNVVEP
jgi:hypothetical protein